MSEMNLRLKPRGRGGLEPIPLPNNRPNQSAYDLEDSSSDEDDDGIPAAKRPSISPPKPLSLAAPSPTTRAKRSLSNADIVLYLGAKRLARGYNMPPRRPTESTVSLNSFLEPSRTAPAPSNHTQPDDEDGCGDDEDEDEDDVQPGLLQSLNNAFHYPQPDQADEAAALQSQKDDLLPAQSNSYADQTTTEPAQDIIANFSDGMDQGNLKTSSNTGISEIPAVPLSNNFSAATNDPYDVPLSPSDDDSRNHNNQTAAAVQHQRKRGRPPKLAAISTLRAPPLLDEVIEGKRKVGRPKKEYPRIRGETDEEYTIRIARIQKKAIPAFAPPRESPESSRTASPELSRRPEAVGRGTPPTADDHRPHVFKPVEFVKEQDTLSNQLQELYSSSDHEALIEDAEDSQSGTESVPAGGLHEEDSEAKDDDDYHEDTMFFNDYESDLEDEEDRDLSVEDSFLHDTERIRNRHTLPAKDAQYFQGPPDDDVTNIQLDYTALNQLCRLLGKSSWTRAGQSWHRSPFRPCDPQSRPAQALLPILFKLENLFQSTPTAPRFNEQNRVLRQHADVINYYLHKIGALVDYIRTQRLEDHNKNTAALNTKPELRQEVAGDLLECVIPSLVHLLASAWGLGGDDWRKASFTTATVELLKRVVLWTVLLSNRLIKELKESPFEECPESKSGKEKWHQQSKERQEVEGLLKRIGELLQHAPDRLERAEVRMYELARQRRRQQRRDEGMKAQRQEAEEARRVAIEEQRKRSLLSIRGVHYGGRSWSSQAKEPSGSDWSREELEFLIVKMQEAYPQAPDMNHVRWELNKSVEDTIAMAKTVLRKMLELARPGQTLEEREAEIHAMMASAQVA
ncbi:hypothetical protein F5Y16DRAFT_195820 [Xylariaceae sp. FL0255]|nr:hypothetical protein F5Y16DRAFT_195820 [Xylariaceae sp. FL0255]